MKRSLTMALVPCKFDLATELADLVRSAIPRDAAIDLAAQFCRVVAACKLLEATRETYARADHAAGETGETAMNTAAVSKIADGGCNSTT